MTETHRLLIALSSITLYVLWVAVIFYKSNKKRCETNVATDKINNTHVDSSDSKKQTLIVYASQTGTRRKDCAC